MAISFPAHFIREMRTRLDSYGEVKLWRGLIEKEELFKKKSNILIVSLENQIWQLKYNCGVISVLNSWNLIKQITTLVGRWSITNKKSRHCWNATMYGIYHICRRPTIKNVQHLKCLGNEELKFKSCLILAVDEWTCF